MFRRRIGAIGLVSALALGAPALVACENDTQREAEELGDEIEKEVEEGLDDAEKELEEDNKNN